MTDKEDEKNWGVSAIDFVTENWYSVGGRFASGDAARKAAGKHYKTIEKVQPNFAKRDRVFITDYRNNEQTEYFE